MKTYTDIRDAIFQEIYDIAKKDKKVTVLSADTGAFMLKKFKEDMPLQFYNVGVAEQNAISVAAGLAFTGRHIFVFGIANFVTLRCFEQIKVDIALMKMPVTILASGTGYVYSEDGPTHHMTENLSLMRTLPGFTIWSPSDCSIATGLVHLAYKTKSPSCIFFDKGPFPSIYQNNSYNFSNGLTILKPGKEVVIISTGIMIGEALKVSAELEKNRIEAGVIDLYRLKPINKELLFETIKDAKRIVTLEEQSIRGGLGGLICEFLAENNLLIPVKIFGIPDTFRCDVGDREMLRSLDGISVACVVNITKNWIKYAL